MKEERVKLGVISNKAFLLLVVDAINSCEKALQIKNREEYITKTDNAIIISTDNVYIISEKSVEAYYFLNSSKRQCSMEYKVSYTYEYDSVAIRVYLLNLMLNGQSVSRQEIYKSNVNNFVDQLLQIIIKDHCTGLLTVTKDIQNYENLTCQLTDDSIYDGALFDTLPDLNIQLQICDKPQNKVDNPNIHHHSNEEKQSLGFMLGILSVIIEDNWKVILGIIGVIIFIISIIAGI